MKLPATPGPVRGLVRLALSVQLLWPLSANVVGQELDGVSGDNPETPLRSPSGHFLVEGPSRLGNQVLMMWAEQTTTRAEQVLGLSIPFERRSIRIRVRSDSNDVSVVQEQVLGHVAQRLFLPDYGDAARDRAREPLCRLLLNAFVIHQAAETGKPGGHGLPSVPRWLSAGISENLYPASKARNSGKVLGRWRAGRLPPLAEILRAQTDPAAEPDSALCGTLVTWILSQPDRAGCFRGLFGRVADGETVSAEWLAPFVPECQTAADLDERWDQWILQQQRMVYDPGLVTASVIRQLETEFTLSPGEPGLPPDVHLHESVGLHDLVNRRQEAWVPAVGRNKAMRLRVLSTGRGQELQAVVESYCRVLEALGSRWTRTTTIEKMLIKAESDFERLRHLVEEAEAEREDPS